MVTFEKEYSSIKDTSETQKYKTGGSSHIWSTIQVNTIKRHDSLLVGSITASTVGSQLSWILEVCLVCSECSNFDTFYLFKE